VIVLPAIISLGSHGIGHEDRPQNRQRPDLKAGRDAVLYSSLFASDLIAAAR
jgi:hypothetical protein